ncbi:MAG: hypothetical protein WC853_09060 [Thermodesulfovibrionales bacterium]
MMKFLDKMYFRISVAVFSMVVFVTFFLPGISLIPQFDNYAINIHRQYHPWIKIAIVLFFGGLILVTSRSQVKFSQDTLKAWAAKRDTAKEEAYTNLGYIQKLYVGRLLYYLTYVLGILSVVYMGFEGSGTHMYISTTRYFETASLPYSESKIYFGTILIALWLIWALAVVFGDSIHKRGTFIRYKHDDMFEK